MKAVILAAGRGTRMGRITDERPKCLVNINGRPILDHLLTALFQSGIRDIVVVAGYKSHDVKQYINGRCSLAVNEQFHQTNSIYSLWLVRKIVDHSPFLLLNADLIFDHHLIKDMLAHPSQTVALVNNDRSLQDGEMNVVIRDGRILRFGKDVSACEADAESGQMVKFTAEGSGVFLQRVHELVEEGEKNLFPAAAYDALIKRSEFWPVYTQGRLWFEIDNQDDLQACRDYLGSRNQENYVK